MHGWRCFYISGPGGKKEHYKARELQRGWLRAPHSVKCVRRALLYIRPLALPHEPALVRAVEKEVSELRRLGRHVRQLRRGRNEAATIVWVVLPVVRLVRGASVCRAASRRENAPVRGRSKVGSDVQAFVMSTLRASASLREACNGKGPFFMAPIHGIGISTSAVCSLSSFFNSKPCKRSGARDQCTKQNHVAAFGCGDDSEASLITRSAATERSHGARSGPFAPSFVTWHNERWVESSPACPCT